MRLADTVLSAACSAALSLVSVYAAAQDYPTKPVRIVTGIAGGSQDLAARIIAQDLSGALGQPVVIDNRPATIIPGQIVSGAPPDGYTLLVSGATLWIGALLQQTPYDAVKDFSPITWISAAPNMLVVHPSLPVKSVKDLIALAKARPGQLNYASGSAGGASHLAGQLFKFMAQVDMVLIPYKANTTKIADLVAGRVQVLFAGAGEVPSAFLENKLRLLAVTSNQPSALAPGVPTVASSGLPGYESISIQGLLGPAKMPPALLDRLNQEAVRSLAKPNVKDKFLALQVEAVGSTPKVFADKIDGEIKKWSKVIKESGMKAE